MTQTLIIGAHQLVVEGLADVVYINVMSDLLRRIGGRGLDPRWTITPVGGIDKIPTFVALLGGSDLDVTVLMDVAAGGNQKLTNLVQRGLLDQQRLIPLTDITKTNEADIEDLFAADWYLKLLRSAGVGSVAKSKLTHGRIVKQVEHALGAATTTTGPPATSCATPAPSSTTSTPTQEPNFNTLWCPSGVRTGDPGPDP